MNANVQTNKFNGKITLDEFIQKDNYQLLKDRLKTDILKDPRLHSLKELFQLYESMDSRLNKIERLLTENLIKKVDE